MQIHYLTVRDVAFIHFLVMKKYGDGEDAGIKEQGLLESAVYRPQQTVFDEDAYPSIFEKAAVFFELMKRNHCFYNGNKRTAFAALDLFLKKNGFTLISDTDKNEDFTITVAEGKMEYTEVISWLEKNTKQYKLD